MMVFLAIKLLSYLNIVCEFTVMIFGPNIMLLRFFFPKVSVVLGAGFGIRKRTGSCFI